MPLAALLCLLGAAVAFADGLEGDFVVRSADLAVREGVYRLDANFDLPIGEAVRRGLADGVPLTLEVDFSLKRVRRFLPDADVADLAQRYQLQYNAVSAHYVLRNDNSGQQESLPTLDAAIAELSRIRGLPVLDKSLVPAGPRYEASVRARIDYGAVPLTLRILMFWVNEWHRESDWYTWTLRP
ncbi:MAG: DUF4390 domain-containing protein [Gammaproteobacteria bacterium]|nr:DUF4390 domain-containing protein [Gammaproteobacteria bacterium]